MAKVLPDKYFSYENFMNGTLPFSEADDITAYSLVFSFLTQIVFLPIMAFERYLYICRPTEVDDVFPTKARVIVYITASTFVAIFASALYILEVLLHIF